MVIRVLLYLAAFLIILHGLVHLMGFVAYWPLGELAALPYKTTLLGQRWAVGATGMRLYSVLWLAAAAGLVLASLILLRGQPAWVWVLGAAAILSLAIAVLDWSNAFRGALISGLLLIPVLLALGLRFEPPSFAAFPETTPELATVSIPAGLPPPVQRFYETIATPSGNPGEAASVPVIDSAVLTLRGKLRFAGITFPARLRFAYEAGRSYRHEIAATFFGAPLLKVDETFIDHQARLALPMGVVQNEPKIDSAANLGLWGESIWFSTIYLTDPRVHWLPVDNNTAQLIVPFVAGEDSFTVAFNPQSGLIERMEAMRYRDAADEEKIRWWFEPRDWVRFHGLLIPSTGAVTWADEGTPWLVVEVEDVAYNVDVGAHIRHVIPDPSDARLVSQ